MSEQPLSANPEFLFHYQRLRRDRAVMRRQGYVLLLAAGLLVGGVLLVGSGGQVGEIENFVPLALLLGFAVLLLCNGVLALRRARQPISDDEVARRRQEERQQLFQFARRGVSWRYWLVVAIQGLVGLVFLLLSIGAVWSLLTNRGYLDVVSLVGISLFLLLGWYSLSSALRRARVLRRLAKLSGQELANRLSLGEATEGE